MMRLEIALHLALAGLCLALALLGEGMYVYFLLHLHNIKDVCLIIYYYYLEFIVSNLCILGLILIRQLWTVHGVVGQGGVLVILAQKPE